MEGTDTEWPSLLRIFGAIGLLLLEGVFGGIAALVAGRTAELGQAIAFGIGWPGLFKGVSEAFRSAARGAVHRQIAAQGGGIPPHP